MIELDNRTDFDVDLPFLESISNSVTDGTIELIVTDDEEIRQINNEFRHIDRATDVLSFPYEPMPMSPIGSIVISYDHVAKGAREFGHTEADEMALLFHGLLHLLGLDHETDSGEMRQKEHALIEQFSLPMSLIVRTEGE